MKNDTNKGRVLARITAEETLKNVTGGVNSCVITGDNNDITNLSWDNDGPLQN